MQRKKLTYLRRVVIKAGSRVLVQKNGRPHVAQIRKLVKEVARLKRAGMEVVVVTSGAVGAGMETLGLKKRPANLPDLQMAAAVGHTRLMTRYDDLFAAEKCAIAQVLLTRGDLTHRHRHLNARNTILNLLRHDVIPIVNENDVVSVDEIKVGDNDILAALVALLIESDGLILLTVSDGLRETMPYGRTRRVSYVPKVTKGVLALASGKAGEISTGGMASKLQAAEMAAKVGILSVIADGRKTSVIQHILQGRDEGTFLDTTEIGKKHSFKARKRWIAFFNRASGTLVIDEGARQAVVSEGKSLLPIGIKRVIGDFEIGSMVNIRTATDHIIGRGLVEYSSGQIKKIKGRRTSEIAGLLGSKDYDEIIHRDNMVLLER